MYTIAKQVIMSKEFELSSMLKKIDSIWFENRITDEEKAELIKLAQENADNTFSMDLQAKIEDLEKRVRVLESNPSPSPSPEKEYEEYQVGKWYYKDDKISYKGKNYICIMPKNQVCTWNPDEYPRGWKEVI